MDRLENSVSRTTLAISLVNKQSPSAALSCGVFDVPACLVRKLWAYHRRVGRVCVVSFFIQASRRYSPCIYPSLPYFLRGFCATRNVRPLSITTRLTNPLLLISLGFLIGGFAAINKWGT